MGGEGDAPAVGGIRQHNSISHVGEGCGRREVSRLRGLHTVALL